MKCRLIFLAFFLLTGKTLFANEVLYLWSGALTHESIKVNVVLQLPASKVRLIVSKTKTWDNPKISEYSSAIAEHGNAVALVVTGLKPSTFYHYCIEIDGTKDMNEKHTGSFTTFHSLPFSYKFVAGSCNLVPNNRVYDKMRTQNPLFFIMPGDLHYVNPSSTSIEPHRDAYENSVLSQPKESKFYRHVPFAYVWDDHDYCGDNNDGTSGCGVAAFNAYKEYIPHYPFGDSTNSGAIYQSFIAGRVKFILTDLRSQRKNGDIMDPQQKTWFKNEVMDAKRKNMLICWVSSVSFSGTRSDNWGGYAATRTELANFFRDSSVTNMFILSGDAHMLAIDNGTHADFSDGKNNPHLYPILQTAALNNVGSDKGGEYSEGGTFPNPPLSSQWSTIEITDNGGKVIGVRFTCYRMSLFTKKHRIITSFEFCRKLTDKYQEKLVNKEMLMATQPDHINGGTTLLVNYKGKAEIRVIDQVGKRHIQKKDVLIDKTYNLSETKELPTGIYYVILETEKGIFLSELTR